MPEPTLDNFFCVPLTHGLFAIIDTEDKEEICKHRWKAKMSNHCWYAVRVVEKNGTCYEIKMHRQIAQTPRGMICHHVNRRTLYNRRCNLWNLSKDEHRWKHKYGTTPERYQPPRPA